MFFSITQYPYFWVSGKQGAAQNVTKHVLLHELGHALFRSFDVPILTNEEVLADSFATFYVTQYARDDAPHIIVARAKSWMFENSQTDPENYNHRTEHPLDIRRAYQALCLFYGADPAEFSQDVAFAGFTKRELAACSDSAPDQMAAWMQIIDQLPKHPPGSTPQIEIIYGDGPMKEAFEATGILAQVGAAASMFDWGDQGITLHFDHCDVGASWSRTERRILLCDDYVARFVAQGRAISAAH